MFGLQEKPLFVFEMANNHMGDVEHGLRIIDRMHAAARDFDFRFAVKFQYRHLDTFIHPDFRDRTDIKYVKRFMETKLTEDEFLTLKGRVQELGMLAMCTPFDEASVEKIERHGYDILKVASCSLTDWPLLERIAQTDLPVIASTAGGTLDEIDRVALFLEHRGKAFALMHCVGEYPTAPDHYEMNQIDLLRERYPEAAIGFSTHEDPGEMDAVKLAVAKGARIFEKHVAVPTDEYGVNAYSATPEQVKAWIGAAAEALVMCGVSGQRRDLPAKELEDLRGLKRGVFARKPIGAGERVTGEDVFFAIPCGEDQVLANDWSKYKVVTTTAPVEAGAALGAANAELIDRRTRIVEIVTRIVDLIREAGISLPNRLDFEISHHYGIDRFEECGAVIINVVNREYCKKLLILLPGQDHPTHAHKIKEETFHVLHGDMTLVLDGDSKTYNAGDFVTVERNVKHSFSSRGGVIVEEISTTHQKMDSYYDDTDITSNPHRKTEMTFWSDWLVNPPR